MGRDPTGDHWSVGIQHPRVADAYVAVTPLDDRCLATSGDYMTTFSPDFGDHHIFQPSTGRSPAELASVSVVAPRAAQADALSTAIMVLGEEAGLALCRRVPGTDALLVTKQGRVARWASPPVKQPSSPCRPSDAAGRAEGHSNFREAPER